ncbi:unnamed protein product, partial [Polarella glacialis]
KAFDVDSEYPQELKVGVPLGVDEDTIEANFIEEEKMDMVIGPTTIEEAATICECAPEDLCAGPLGANEEADKLRTIFDGTAPHMNTHIRKNTKEKTTCPGLPDALYGLHWLHKYGQEPWWLPPEHVPTAVGVSGPEGTWDEEEWVLLKADVTKAHRRVKIRKKGWKYQIAIIKGKYWITKVGTYGIASAQLYWGRLAALKLRLLNYMFPSLDWAFVYVDDFAFLIRRCWANTLAWALLATMAALGCPLSWKKTIMGLVNTWLGFQIQTKLPAAAVGHLKHRVMVSLLLGISAGKLYSQDQIAEGLGRLQWATNASPLVKPFLQPFWAWKTAVTQAGRPSYLLRMIARVILLLINSVITSTYPFCRTSSTHGAATLHSESQDQEMALLTEIVMDILANSWLLLPKLMLLGKAARRGLHNVRSLEASESSSQTSEEAEAEDTQVYAAGFDTDMTDEAIREYFAKAGPIVKYEARGKGRARLTYSSAADAKNAAWGTEGLEERCLRGSLLAVVLFCLHLFGTNFIAGFPLPQTSRRNLHKVCALETPESSSEASEGDEAESTRVFVAGFDRSMTEQAIREYFAKAGPIVGYETSGAGRARLTFSSAADAKNAVASLNGTTIEGNGKSRWLLVKPYVAYVVKRTSTIHVSGFALGTAETALREHFGTAGAIVDFKLLGNRSAWVTYSSNEEGASAAFSLNGKPMEGNDKLLAVRFKGAAKVPRTTPPEAEVVEKTKKAKKTKKVKESKYPADASVIYVGQLEIGTAETALREHFGTAGTIVDVKFLGNRSAWVNYSSNEEVALAVASLNGKSMKGNDRLLDVRVKGDPKVARTARTNPAEGGVLDEIKKNKKSKKSIKKELPTENTVVVFGFDRGINTTVIKEHCGKAGSIVDSKRTRTCLLLTYSSVEEAATAVASLNGTTIQGSSRFIIVDHSRGAREVKVPAEELHEEAVA